MSKLVSIAIRVSSLKRMEVELPKGCTIFGGELIAEELMLEILCDTTLSEEQEKYTFEFFWLGDEVDESFTFLTKFYVNIASEFMSNGQRPCYVFYKKV